MNSTALSSSAYFANLQIVIIRSLLTPTYIIGTLNNLANIFIFYQYSLRINICSWYFIGASIGHLFYLNFGCLTRVIWAWTKYDLSVFSLPYCRFRIYVVLNGLTISRYFFCLISIDRWMITSRNAHIRQLSSAKVARWLIIVGISFLSLVNLFVSVNYIIDRTAGCASRTDSFYAIFFTIYNTMLSLVPLSTLFIFSLLILMNIKQVKGRISPTELATIHVHPSPIRRKYPKKDIQFIKLSLVQVAGYMLFNTLHAYNTIYGIITTNKHKTSDQRAVDGFLYGMGLNLHYVYTGVCFICTFLRIIFHCFAFRLPSFCTQLHR